MKDLFFKPFVGNKNQGRLILLATAPCIHTNAYCFEECTRQKKSYKFNDICPYYDTSFDETARRINLDENSSYIIEKHIKNKYKEVGEPRNKTLTKLSNALYAALDEGGSYPLDEKKLTDLWENFICTELCQHFIPANENRKGFQTLPSDFEDKDFDALKELILEYNIKKILILGTPSWNFLMKKMNNSKPEIKLLPENTPSGYWHQMLFNGKKIDLMYAWHPSYRNFYDNDNESGNLITWLKRFFFSKAPWDTFKPL